MIDIKIFFFSLSLSLSCISSTIYLLVLHACIQHVLASSLLAYLASDPLMILSFLQEQMNILQN